MGEINLSLSHHGSRQHLVLQAKEVRSWFKEVQDMLQRTWSHQEISPEFVPSVLQRVLRRHWIQEARLDVNRPAPSKDSVRLVKRCTKPDRKEFSKIAIATAIGFALMGFIGFFVKLIHIPINNIIVGA